MAVRTAYPATEAVGDVLTKANFDKLPGGWIGYAEAVADQTGITTEVDLTSLSVTVTVNTARRIRITAYLPNVTTTVAADIARLSLKEGGTLLNLAQRTVTTTNGATVRAEWVGTPTAGAHTYKATIVRQSGTGTLVSSAGATFPAFILVEDLGPAA